MFLLASAASVLLLRFVHLLVAGWIPVPARPLAFVLVLAGGLLLGHAWTFREVDGRGWALVGLGRGAWDLRSAGTAASLGTLAIAVPCALLLSLGWLRLESSGAGSSSGAALAAMALLLPAAAWEELLLRGYAFVTLRERWGEAGAIGATSLAFGAMHVLNAGASGGSLAVVVLAGVFLGLVRARTDSLVAAWAAHVAWNATLVVGLHAAVSGVQLYAPDYRLVDAGPDWATGGAWGPEGGAFAAAGLLVAIVAVNRWRRGRQEPDA